ncbi:MAG: tetratricopeptide repeat protein, partial [Deltaproteobacteria bacterium]
MASDQTTRSESGKGEAGSVGRELQELRREILESRNLVIKTDNLLRGLHAEVKALGKHQEDWERRSWISSGVAYGAFALLAALGAGLTAKGYVASAEQETISAKAQAASAQKDAQAARAALEATHGASNAAAKAYAQMAGEPAARLAAAAAVAALDRRQLTPLEARALDDRARAVR